MPGKLSRTETVAWVSGVGVLLLTLIGHVLIREWYQADLRYEIEGYYRSQGTAVASLKLENHGRSEAGVVKVAAAFPSTIRNLTTSEPTSPFEVLEGGIGTRAVVGRIDRLVPGQTLYLYFAVVDPGGTLSGEYESYVGSITFAGGEARPGGPVRPFVAGFGWALLAVLVLVPIAFAIVSRKGWLPRRGGLGADIGPAKSAVKDAMVSVQAVIELAGDVETLVRAGESLPKPFVERFSKYKDDASKMKRRLLSHARPNEAPGRGDQAESRRGGP